MMGRTHALTGWCAGLATAPLIGAGTVHQAVAFAVTTAGFALLPDLDHPGARASRLLGPVTGAISWLLRKASANLYQITKGPRDERCKGTHRHLSHTVLFAVVLGLLTTVATNAGGWWVAAVIVLFAVMLAEDALGDWLLPVAVAAIAWWVYTAGSTGATELAQMSDWLGVAVTVGCITHCLGDALTESGCPFLFPIPIAGETWYELRPPKIFRFRTGKGVENFVIFPVFAILAALLVPGMWELILNIADNFLNQPTVQAGPL